jgi:hypothetical protein
MSAGNRMPRSDGALSKEGIGAICARVITRADDNRLVSAKKIACRWLRYIKGHMI